MRALLDVNVLIALLDADHASHDSAISWFAKHAREGWASCPITQNGCIRIMSNPGYPNPLPVQAVIEHLAEACHQDIHEFWPDEVSLLDSDVVDSTRIHGPRQLTDIYLLLSRFNIKDGSLLLIRAFRSPRSGKLQRRNC